MVPGPGSGTFTGRENSIFEPLLATYAPSSETTFATTFCSATFHCWKYGSRMFGSIWKKLRGTRFKPWEIGENMLASVLAGVGAVLKLESSSARNGGLTMPVLSDRFPWIKP